MPVDEGELRSIIDELQQAWADHGDADALYQPAARRDRPFTGYDTVRLAIVFGWTRHLYETARAAVLLIDNGMPNAAVPLVRQMYECALSAVWLVQSRDQHGVHAIVREHGRNRSALMNEVRNAESLTFRRTADDVADVGLGSDRETLDTARRFRDICLDLTPGGVDLYILYRLLSSYSHASLSVTDLYYKNPDSETQVLPYRLAQARPAIPAETLLNAAAIALVWGARAYTYTSKDKTHRSIIRRLANALGVTSELQLSDHYRRRHATQSGRSTAP